MIQTQNPERIVTTLAALLEAIDDVANTQEEAFAVLERMLDEGRISLLRADEIAVAA